MTPFKSAEVCTVVLVAVCLGIAQQSTQPIQVSNGKISGTNQNGVAAYLGISYAKPPIGQLRWRPPQMPTVWKGIRKADHFGSSCMQARVPAFLPWTEEFMTQNRFSEDCLYLNLWTTAKRDENQAVMVFIHGGGFLGGSGSVALYNGAELAKNGVVVVNLNYRLGALGFFVHPELTNESENHSSGNYGLLDQIAALKWIKQNIAAFGGDPKKVTIFGQSAGAISVIDLMRSPLAQGLFARAIVQSDPTIFVHSNDPLLGSSVLAEREKEGVKYADSIGAHSLADLRKLPAEEFFKGDAFPTPAKKSLMYRGGPVNDGWVLTREHPAHEVPLMVGMVAADVNMADGFGPQPPNTVANYEGEARKNFGEKAIEFLRLYAVKSDDDVAGMRRSSREDQSRVALDLWSAQQLKRSGAVYTYFFDRPIPWPAHPEFGAFHSSELPYIFKTNSLLDRPWQSVDFKLADQMAAYWSNFAKSGDPNGPDLPKWPKYAPDFHEAMQLGEHTGAMQNAQPSRLKFLLESLHLM